LRLSPVASGKNRRTRRRSTGADWGVGLGKEGRDRKLGRSTAAGMICHAIIAVSPDETIKRINHGQSRG
jgi:hypothetical protein